MPALQSAAGSAPALHYAFCTLHYAFVFVPRRWFRWRFRKSSGVRFNVRLTPRSRGVAEGAEV